MCGLVLQNIKYLGSIVFKKHLPDKSIRIFKTIYYGFISLEENILVVLFEKKQY